jgi:EmrB/QacA subfamily drug resistance transporter
VRRDAHDHPRPTIANIALKPIHDSLHFSGAGLAWVINAYMLTFGGFLLLAGRMGDLFGTRRLFLAGLVTFTLASLACGLAPSKETLIAARFIQGIGGAMTSAVILGMIVTMFREPREQAKAIGVYSFIASAGASIGLLLGGVLTQAINWHWIFFVNVPIGVLTGLFALRLVRDNEGLGLRSGADGLGALLVTGALMLGVYTILEAGRHGWTSLHTLGFGAAAVALLAGFVSRESSTPHPLVPLAIFRSRNISGANAIQGLMVAGLFGMFFMGVLYLQRVLGYDAIETGLAFLPVSVLIGALSLGVSARLNERFGARATLLAGLTLIVAGLAYFARVPTDGTYVVDVLPVMLLFGAGAGLSFPSLMTLAMSGVTPSESGLASGLANTTLQVGGAVGLAALATLATSRTDALIAAGEPAAAALTGGYHLAFVIGGGLVLAGLLVAATVLRPAADAVAEKDDVAVAEPAYAEAA